MSVKAPQSRERLFSEVARQSTAGSEKAAPANRLASGIASFLHTVGFALWFGGLIVLGAVVAPNITGLLQNHPEIAGNSALKNAVLNATIGNSFRALNPIAYVCAGLMLLADFLSLRSAGRQFRTATLSRAGFTVLALATVVYQGVVLFPAMDNAQASHNMAAFDQMHSLYTLLGMAQMPLLLVVALVSAVRSALAHA